MASDGSPRRELGARADRFNEGRAWGLVELQLRYGQRPAGSAALRRLAERLRPLLPAGRFERVPGRGLRNIVGTLPGRRPGIVVGAHYDVLADPAGFVGANNGAAGTAVALEVARDAVAGSAHRRAPRSGSSSSTARRPTARPSRSWTSSGSGCGARARTSPLTPRERGR